MPKRNSRNLSYELSRLWAHLLFSALPSVYSAYDGFVASAYEVIH